MATALSTAFDIAQGGVDTAAGSDMIKKARELRSEGHISEGEYNEMIRNGRLRVAQGSFGLANGMQNVVKFVGKRVEKNILKKSRHGWSKVTEANQAFRVFYWWCDICWYECCVYGKERNRRK